MSSDRSTSSKRAARARPATPSSLSQLEGEVMEEIWTQGEASVRSVMEAMNGALSKPRAYTTYMTIMVRLEGNGVVRRRRQGKSDVYAPVFSREQYAERRAESEVDAIVQEFGEVALTQFARRIAEMDPQRREVLQRLARGRSDEGTPG